MTAKKQSAAKPFQLLDKEGTKKLIGQIQKSGKKLDADIQTALQCSAIHAHQHGDITLLESLLPALPKGVRSNAVKEWMMQYAPVAFVKGALVFQRSYDNKDDAARQTAIKACETATPWLEFKPEPEFVPFDLAGRLGTLVKAAENALADPEHQHKVTPEQLAEVKRVLQALA